MAEESSFKTDQARQYYDRGVAAYKKDNCDYAIELLTQAISLEPENASARHFLRLAERKRLKISPPSIINKVKSIIPSIATSWFQMQRKPEKVMEACEKVLRSNPDNVPILMKLAKVSLKKNMIEVATKTFEEIFELDPDNIPALKQLTTTYSQKRGKDDLEKARLYFERVLKLAPHDREADRGLKDLDALRTIERGEWGRETEKKL